MCECVNETSYLLISFCLEDAPKALQFKSPPHNATSVIGDPAEVRGGERFFGKKCRKNLRKGKCLTYLCSVNRERHKPYTKGITRVYEWRKSAIGYRTASPIGRPAGYWI